MLWYAPITMVLYLKFFLNPNVVGVSGKTSGVSVPSSSTVLDASYKPSGASVPLSPTVVGSSGKPSEASEMTYKILRLSICYK